MSSFNLRGSAAAGLLLAALSPGLAQAQTVSSDLPVSATVVNKCTISTTPVNFGVIDTLTPGVVNGEGALIVTCTNGTSFAATADVGKGPNANFSERKMQPAVPNGDFVFYNLFTDSTRSTLWGDFNGGSGSKPIFGTGTGTTQNVPIYARTASRPALENDAYSAGQYSDIVTVTLNY